MEDRGLGRSVLRPTEQKLYDGIERALLRHERVIPIAAGPGLHVEDILYTVIGDHPELIYFDKSHFLAGSGLFLKTRLELRGVITGAVEKKREMALQDAVEEAAFEVDKASRDDFEILRGISEYIQKSTRYDYTAAANPGGRYKEAHSAYGALVEHSAVCDGIASAFCCIAKELGFPCMVVSGTSHLPNEKPVNHAWVILSYDGALYHLDPTWDLNLYEGARVYGYTYFGLDDDAIALDHTWNIQKTPSCRGQELNYFSHNGLVIQSRDDIRKVTRQQLRSGQNVIWLQLGCNITDAASDGSNIAQLVCESAAALLGGITTTYSYNNVQRTLMVKINRS